MTGPTARPRLERRYFEDLYERDPDPWGFESSAYEKEKYARTLAALGERRFDHALEVGCSIGVFTAALAPLCRRLLAVDTSERAVAATERRLSQRPWVRVERRTLPEEAPAGPFDLIVCSEVLYYWPEPELATGLDALSASLGQGGLLLAVHFTEPTRTYPLQGGRVHELLRAHPALRPVLGQERPHYRLDLFERA